MITEETIKKLDDLKIDELYQNGASTAELRKEFHLAYNTLRQYFIIKKIPIHPARRRKSLRPPAPIGQKFGMWTVVSTEVKSGNECGKKDRSLYWLVQCECGQLAWKNHISLQNGTTTKCKKCGNKSFITENGEVKTNAVILYKYNQTQNNIPTRTHRGRRNPLKFNLSLTKIEELYEQQNHQCALSGISIEPDLTKRLQQQNLSIDRIDSFKDYEDDNIQLVDKRINMMKGSLSNEEFIELCIKVADFQRSKHN